MTASESRVITRSSVCPALWVIEVMHLMHLMSIMGIFLVTNADYLVDNDGQRIRTNALYALTNVFVCIVIARQHIRQRIRPDSLFVNQRIDNLFHRVC